MRLQPSKLPPMPPELQRPSEPCASPPPSRVVGVSPSRRSTPDRRDMFGHKRQPATKSFSDIHPMSRKRAAARNQLLCVEVVDPFLGPTLYAPPTSPSGVIPEHWSSPAMSFGVTRRLTGN